MLDGKTENCQSCGAEYDSAFKPCASCNRQFPINAVTPYVEVLVAWIKTARKSGMLHQNKLIEMARGEGQRTTALVSSIYYALVQLGITGVLEERKVDHRGSVVGQRFFYIPTGQTQESTITRLRNQASL